MRIAFLFTQLEVGGAQTRVMQTAAEMRARGHDVDVYALYKARDAFIDQPKSILSRSKNPLSILFGLLRFWFVLLSRNYEIVITNTAPANIAGCTVAALAFRKTRIAWQTQPPARLSRALQLLDHFCGRIGIYTASVANSHWTRTCFEGRSAAYRRRMHVIVNGLNPRVDSRSKEACRAAVGVSCSEKIVVTVGRLSRQKGQDTLFRAMKAVPDARLVVIGDGELRADYVRLVEQLQLGDRISFTGEIPGEQVATYLKAADLFAFPSRWETFGLAVVEAAAAEIPLVCSDLDVLKEVVRLDTGEFAARLVPVDDPSALASEIQRLLASPEDMAKLSRLSARLKTAHSLSVHVDNILSLVERLNANR